jgi:hypothetical protein
MLLFSITARSVGMAQREKKAGNSTAPADIPAGPGFVQNQHVQRRLSLHKETQSATTINSATNAMHARPMQPDATALPLTPAVRKSALPPLAAETSKKADSKALSAGELAVSTATRATPRTAPHVAGKNAAVEASRAASPLMLGVAVEGDVGDRNQAALVGAGRASPLPPLVQRPPEAEQTTLVPIERAHIEQRNRAKSDSDSNTNGVVGTATTAAFAVQTTTVPADPAPLTASQVERARIASAPVVVQGAVPVATLKAPSTGESTIA